VAGAGSLVVTVAAWFSLSGLGSRLQPHAESAGGPQKDGAGGPQTDAMRESQVDGHRSGTRRDSPRTPAVRHQ
jgi:hypothetical protein